MPDANNILQISKLFGVTADYLLNDDYTSDNDVPKIKKTKEANTQLILIALVTLEGMLFVLQFLATFVLQNAVFEILSFLPFIACIGGFEYGYRKKASEQNDVTRLFRRKFYKISAWLSLYFPIRFLVSVCMTFYPRPYYSFVLECITVVVYIVAVLAVTVGINKHCFKKNS